MFCEAGEGLSDDDDESLNDEQEEVMLSHVSFSVSGQDREGR